MTLLALTLAQPWPWAVLELGKRLENRTWADDTVKRMCNNKSWFAIHGGKVPKAGKNAKKRNLDDDVFWIQNHSPAAYQRGFLDTFSDKMGFDFEGIVAVCQIETIYDPGQQLAPRHKAQEGWRARDPDGYHGQYAWMLENLIILENPVKVPGAQGLWAVTGDVLEQVRVEARRARELVSP
jgi:hypothetical protein